MKRFINWASTAMGALLFGGILYLFFYTHAPGADAIKRIMVHFECAEEWQAVDVAHKLGSLESSTTPMPNGCYWVTGEKMADVLKLTRPVSLASGEVVWVGIVKRSGKSEAFSAGHLELDMM